MQGCDFSIMDHPPQPHRHQLPASRSNAARETILLSCVMECLSKQARTRRPGDGGTIHALRPKSALPPRSRIRSFYGTSCWVALMHDTSSDRTLWSFRPLPYGFVLNFCHAGPVFVQNVQCIEPSRSCSYKKKKPSMK
jgi:hypothetical protein